MPERPLVCDKRTALQRRGLGLMFQDLYKEERDKKQQARKEMQATDSSKREKTGPWIRGVGGT
jgi:hypothetical protein